HIFRTQFRPLLHASPYPKLNIIFPMLPTIKHFTHPKPILLQQKHKLTTQPQLENLIPQSQQFQQKI
ncbi:putative PEP-binding protein, partial [Staphylococcus hominis]|uniref:putative PEP-binding protein n=1 Tax=Staphylococcus hominis TaxID=1290 RepID=UPI00119F17BE